MNNAEFGLAQVKREGSIVNVATGKEVSAEEAGLYKPSKTRWIELCYDPNESMGRIDLEPLREAIQTQQSCNNYTEDEMYLIIKSLANEFIAEGGL
tara:strand:+ start:99 stop:386 length:288 start_codon:yes stop_codon:yes gene_type:complete